MPTCFTFPPLHLLDSDGSSASPNDSESHHSLVFNKVRACDSISSAYPTMYAHRVVSLTTATSVENLRALNEVRDFATTDMGLGGPERWTYRVLEEPGLSAELQRLANPTSTPGGTDSIDFQPCQMHEFRTQDRKCVEHWRMPSGGIWVFTAIFDGQFTHLVPARRRGNRFIWRGGYDMPGHAGHATVEHASRTLPFMIRQALESLLRSFRGHGFPAAVSRLLSDCVTRFDHSITADFMRMFPGGPASLQGMSGTQVRNLFQDRTSGAQNLTAATRCLQGSTVILTLTDPSKHNLWITNLGDCQAGVCQLRTSSLTRCFYLTLLDVIS
jgi:pyruvate dehydrogenase phosphatase